MANRRLTQRLIDTLTPGKSVREIRDKELRGFGLRILPCCVQAQGDGRRQWTTDGRTGTAHAAASDTGRDSRQSRDIMLPSRPEARTSDRSQSLRSIVAYRSRVSRNPTPTPPPSRA